MSSGRRIKVSFIQLHVCSLVILIILSSLFSPPPNTHTVETLYHEDPEFQKKVRLMAKIYTGM